MEILTQLNLPFEKKDEAKAQFPGKLTWDPNVRSWFFRGPANLLPEGLKVYYTPPPTPPKPGASVAPQAVARPVRPMGSEFHVLCLPFTYQQFAAAQGARWNPSWRVNTWYGIKANMPVALTGFDPKPFSYEAYVQEKLNNRKAPVLPAAKSIILRDHQVVGVKEILRSFSLGYPGFLLADDVGLGKTHTAWSSVLTHFKQPIKVAIIAPLSVHPGWRDSILAQGNGGHTVVILNYERLRNLYDEPEVTDKSKKIGKRRALKRIANQGTPKDFQVYIWDESHYMKNLEAARSKLGVGLYRRGTHHLWLSATAGQNPMELGYLLPMLRARTEGVVDLSPPAPKDFEAWYQSAGLRVKRGAFGKWQLGATAQEQDEDCRKVADMLWSPDKRGVRGALRRLPSDLVGWPELQRILWPVELADEEQKLYDKEWKQFLTDFRTEKASGKAQTGSTPGAAALLRFRMKASLLRAKHTAEFAEDLIDNGHQVAISVEWQGTLEEIGKELTKRGIGFARITGKEIGEAREIERRKYQLGEVPAVIFTVKEGINLQEGELHEPDKHRAQIDHDVRWSAISMHQIDGRSHRNGKFAKVYWAYADGTKETDVAEKLLAKLKGMKTMMGENDINLAELEKLFTGS